MNLQNLKFLFKHSAKIILYIHVLYHVKMTEINHQILFAKPSNKNGRGVTVTLLWELLFFS